MTFKSLNVPTFLETALEQGGITSPTPIQKESIPTGLEGRDVLASAQTGTGKTIAFLVPVLAKLADDRKAKAVILAPTRELAFQIMQSAQSILKYSTTRINYALLIGGSSFGKQFEQLRNNARLIIGTPGRVVDHLERGSLNLKDARVIVLDETDRMLDMGFSDQLNAIKFRMPDSHQTLMFSATLPGDILELSQQYLVDPVRITVGQNNTPAATIKQDVLHLSRDEKLPSLLKEIDKREGSIIVFAATKYGTGILAEQLKGEGLSVAAIHGDLSQDQRNRVMKGFKLGNYRILVATDVAARGLDVPSVEHVVNFDLPMQASDYVHRIGRTGRAGAEGNALSFVSHDEKRKWKMIGDLVDPKREMDIFDFARVAPAQKRSNSPFGNRNSARKKPRYATRKGF